MFIVIRNLKIIISAFGFNCKMNGQIFNTQELRKKALIQNSIKSQLTIV